jgi:hypothetical protein
MMIIFYYTVEVVTEFGTSGNEPKNIPRKALKTLLSEHRRCEFGGF